MKRLKLTKKKQLRAFVEDCMKYSSPTTRAIVTGRRINKENAFFIYMTFMSDWNLWGIKQYCLLKPETRRTFEYYNSLKPKKLNKELLKK